jgi:hypothetical protein
MTAIGKFEYDGQTISIVRTEYLRNGRAAVKLVTAKGNEFAMLSCNLPDEHIPDDQFAVKIWSENEPLISHCAPFFEDTGRRVVAGYCEAPVWRFK